MPLHISTRALGYVAAAAWGTSMAMLVAMLVTGVNLRPVNMFTLAVAITSSIGFIVAREREPLDEVFDLGYSAGWTDRDRSGRPIVLSHPTVRLRRCDDRVPQTDHLDVS